MRGAFREIGWVCMGNILLCGCSAAGNKSVVEGQPTVQVYSIQVEAAFPGKTAQEVENSTEALSSFMLKNFDSDEIKSVYKTNQAEWVMTLRSAPVDLLDSADRAMDRFILADSNWRDVEYTITIDSAAASSTLTAQIP